MLADFALTMPRRRLFFFVVHFHGLQVFGFEDLTAVEAFKVLDPVASSNDLGTGVVAGGKHNSE